MVPQVRNKHIIIINATHYSYRTTTHTFPHCNTHAFRQTQLWEITLDFEALYAGRDRRNHVRSGKEAHRSLRGWIVK